MNDIARNLRHHMQLQSLNSSELARRAEVKSSFIYDILNGKSTNPSTLKLARVAGSLGIPLSQLAHGEAAQSQPSLRIVASNAYDSPFTPPRLHAQYEQGKLCIECLPDTAAPLAFSRRWLTQQGLPEPDALASWSVNDEAMRPHLNIGDQLLIDRSHTMPSPAGIYVISDGLGLAVRRLEYLQTEHYAYIRVQPDNPCYSSYQKKVHEIEVVGRVVWAGRSLL